MSDELCFMTALALSKAFEAKELSPLDVTRAMLARMERLNPLINAIYYVDEEGALTSARQAEERWQKGAPLSPFDGVPTTVKDGLFIKGMPGFRGTASNREEIAREDHPTVARLRESGAVFLGKNTMCDYGIIAAGVSSQYGVTRNPWDLSCTPGASSSGAGATVAAGIGPWSIGTDIVGSIRVPASYCALVGHKPSYGRVPYHFPNSPAIVAGPMTRTVGDAAAMLSLLAKPDARDFTALPYEPVDYLAELSSFSLKGKKALLILDLGFGLPVDEEVKRHVQKAAQLLEEAGLELTVLEEAPFASDADASAEAFYRMRCLAEYGVLPLEQQKKSPVIWEWTREGLEMSAAELYQAFNDMQMKREQAANLITSYDFLLLPSTPIPAHEAELPTPQEGKLFAPWCNTFLFNLTEQPATSLNCGFTDKGLPIGLQIVGHRYDDKGVLQMAKAYEALRGETITWPHLTIKEE